MENPIWVDDDWGYPYDSGSPNIVLVCSGNSKSENNWSILALNRFKRFSGLKRYLKLEATRHKLMMTVE